MNVISVGSVTAKTNAVYKMFSSDQLIQILGTLTDQPHFCVAYSGGLDSHVLLHAMREIASQHPNIQVRVIHVNHGLNSNADAWQKHCERVCSDLGIELISQSVELNIKPGDSIEAAARAARYECFKKLLSFNENLITAHTKNDQAETLLLQLMRGAGVKGLAAMPIKKTFSQGHLLRPLLTFTREQLEVYANQHALKWIEDDSNSEMRFDRNYMRHQIVPRLQARWPEALTTLTRSAQHCGESAELLDQLADIDLKWVSDETRQSLLISSLAQLSEERQRNILRRWIVWRGYRLPNTKHLKQIVETVLQACEDAQPEVSWDNAEIRRYQNRLYLMDSLSAHDASQIIPWDLRRPLPLPDHLGTLSVKTVSGHGISAALKSDQITVRFRQGGERCQPVGRKETHSLKNLMQEWRVPPWQRDRIPLIYVGETLIAVLGYCVCEGFAAKEDEVGYDMVILLNKEAANEAPTNHS